MHSIQRFLVTLIKKLRFLSSIAVRLTKLTGKSDYPVHPKHLVREEKLWFLPEIKNHDIVLDLGCDNGRNTLALAERALKVTGVDYKSSGLLEARDLAKKKRKKNLSFKQVDLEKKLPFKDNYFDAVLFLDVLEHLYNRDLAMKEVVRMLKPGGKLLLSIPNSETSWKKLQRKVGVNSFADPDHKIEYTLDKAKRVCTEQKLEIKSVMPITLDTPLAPLIDLAGGVTLGIYNRLLNWKDKKAAFSLEETTGFRIIALKIR